MDGNEDNSNTSNDSGITEEDLKHIAGGGRRDGPPIQKDDQDKDYPDKKIDHGSDGSGGEFGSSGIKGKKGDKK